MFACFNVEGCNIKGGHVGIHLTMSREGRPSGEAFVELATPEDLEKAMRKDREHIGHRYIEGKEARFYIKYDKYRCS